jgi:hypothetical protein
VPWILVSAAGLPFAGRILWEKTILTWREGPQNIGFSLAHIHPEFFLVGIIATFFYVIWLLVSAAWFSQHKVRPDVTSWIALSLTVLALVAVFLPS